ncbi:2-(3-amino-3-carboxypropyl)histidine synthase subunit 2-like [Amphiura filiformis]|uniref:2-(3-amino-3-carboxypropyl)histidine synthase subunit 2-like n=1 Tax=Amphiura filiformis TaxID=82378 RepID=UPI003B216724
MESATAFYSGTEVIQRSISVDDTLTIKAGNVHSVYEISQCLQFINSNEFKKVALQFPDELLGDSGAVIKALEEGTTTKIFVLADTSYGSCCVDEIASQHANADCIIHYGSACLSPTSRLPVLYVFGQQPVDVAHCYDQITKCSQDSEEPVLLMYDVVYAHAIDELERLLHSTHPGVIVSKVNASPSTSSNSYRASDAVKPTALDDEHTSKDLSQDKDNSSSLLSKDNITDSSLSVDNTATNSASSQCHFGRTFTLADNCTIDDYAVFYIGSEGRTLTNLMMTFNKCPFYTYDPRTQIYRRETLNVNRALMKRYYLVEKGKDANVVGIVVGTLGVRDYLAVIAHLKEIIKKAGKKSYTFLVGKLNVAKLANFMEVDVFVLVSCPENSLLDNQEFYKPVLTPFEMELACNRAREWTGDYVTDFRQILPGASKHVPLPADNTPSETDVSLITGNLRTLGTDDDTESSVGDAKAVVARDNMAITTHSSAGEYLAGRSWRGLEQDLGNTPVTKAVEGMKGIAAGYANETDEGTQV